ncbi:hypothetical protein MTIM_52680 [Mycobacterium timonense]|uniref:Uncharacterized protein n=1 Tax=Mycobacterium timonense TaxID=701043 RepID=A0A7I9ZEG5_9MYCO|nr:hypothetical protein MTIM_52680 [Mycobacterium timonense]
MQVDQAASLWGSSEAQVGETLEECAQRGGTDAGQGGTEAGINYLMPIVTGPR